MESIVWTLLGYSALLFGVVAVVIASASRDSVRASCGAFFRDFLGVSRGEMGHR